MHNVDAAWTIQLILDKVEKKIQYEVIDLYVMQFIDFTKN